ncbi:SHNi-TPR-domain-containing protein [Gorgonomyces haynaldii]|nr:SHNi-TPR-domain-containing protein [Gorgonomyces haynaldii]
MTNAEVAPVEEIPEQQNLKKTMEDYNELIQQGAQAFALGQFDVAAETLALAVEKQVEQCGQYALECGSTFFLYGKALLASAAQKNTVLGDKVDQTEEEPDIDSNLAKEAKPSSHFVFEDQEEETEDQETTALEEIEVTEETDDLELAWENLDVARLIFEKSDTLESKLALADVHLALGDVSLESENFDQAVQDFTACLELKAQLLPEDHRERAEAHYKLALAYEYTEQIEAAIEQVNASIAVLHKKIETLKGTDEGKGKGTEPVLSEKELEEVKEIEALFPEMESKLSDLTAALEKEEAEGVIGEASEKPAVADQPVQDISGLVKPKRKETEETQDEVKKPKLE